MDKKSSILLPHGGYKNLKTFQLAQLVYDITVAFSQKYIDFKSRTRDQMVQSARSGVQNIAEGSMDAATSSKIEINLYNIARGSLVELQRDYEDFLRQNSFPQFSPEAPAMVRFKGLKCQTIEQFREWVHTERTQPHGYTGIHGDTRRYTEDLISVFPRVPLCSPVSPCSPPPSSMLVANGVLSLLNLTIYLLSRQIAAKENRFLTQGGFAENMARQRKQMWNPKKL